MPAHDLQPVVPDPKKLRRTAWILVAIMIVGGFVILKAYGKRTQEGSRDDRPSFVTQIPKEKDLSFMRQDGKVTDLISLKGKVLVVQSAPQSQPDAMTMAVMKRLAEKFHGNGDVVLVTLVLDPGPAEVLATQLRGVSTGLGAELPQWVVGSNQRETLHKFIKNEFKANMLPHEKDGEWRYDRSIVLIDKNRHVRRAVIPQAGGRSYVTPFDFDQAREWDEQGLLTKTELSNTEQMEALLSATIDRLLLEGLEKEKGISPAVILIGTGCGFLLLIALVILKSRLARNPATKP